MSSWLKSIAHLAAECRAALEEYRVHKLCTELQGNVVRSLVQVQECRRDNRPVYWKMAGRAQRGFFFAGKFNALPDTVLIDNIRQIVYNSISPPRSRSRSRSATRLCDAFARKTRTYACQIRFYTSTFLSALMSALQSCDITLRSDRTHSSTQWPLLSCTAISR
jgi:hypothetical protein